MAEEKIVMDFKIDAEESLKILAEINIQMADLAKQKDALDKAMKDGTATKEMVAQYTEIEAAMKTLQKARKAEEKEIYQEAQQYRYAADSVQGMSDRLRQMKDRYIKMSQAEREGAVGKELAKNIRNTTNQIEIMQKTIKPTIFDKLKNGIKGIGIAIKANPIGAILTVILFVIQKIKSAIQQNEQAMAAIKKAMQSLQPVMQIMQQVLVVIANILAKIIEHIASIINKIIDSKFGKAIQKMLGISIDTSKAAEKTAESAEKVEKSVDDTADKIKEQQERAKEFAKNTKELSKLVEDLSANAIEDETERSLKQAEIANKRTIEEYKEKYRGQKQLNELLKLEEERYQKERGDIIAKAEEDQKKIKEEANKLYLKAQEVEDKLARDKEFNAIKEDEVKKTAFLEEEAKKRQEATQQALQELLNTSTEGMDDKQLAEHTKAVADAKRADYEATLAYNQAKIDSNKAVADSIEAERLETVKAQQDMIKGYMDIANAASSVIGSIHNLFNAIVGDQAEATEFQKALAMVQIIIDTAVATVSAISGATKAGASFGVLAPAMIPAFIAELVGIVSSAIASSIAVFKKTKTPSTPKFATGGLVGNQTTTRTDDTVDAKLSVGEYVIRSKAVKALGVDFLDRLNGGRGDNTNRFATGGLVPSIPTVSAIDSQVNYDQMRALVAEAVENIHPVVSVKEVTNMQQKVQVKENIARY